MIEPAKKLFVPLFPFILLSCWLLFELSFLKADPYSTLNSRDAWTDEGLYSAPLRNLVNHHYYNVTESDSLVKTPLFGFTLIPFFLLLGTHLWVSRLFVLLFTALVIFIFLKDKFLHRFGLLMLLLCFTQYHIFQYSHYGLAEMYCIDFILLSLFFLYRWGIGKAPNASLFLSVMFSSFCWYAKIQFAYIVWIVPGVVFFCTVKDYFETTRLQYKALLLTLLYIIIFALIYYRMWYIPNHRFFDYVMLIQGKDRFDVFSQIFDRIKYTFNLEVWVSTVKHYVYTLVFSLVGLLYLLIRKRGKHTGWLKDDRGSFVLFLFVFCWFLTELHKLYLISPPTRYLLAFFFSGAMLITVSLFMLEQSGKLAKALVSVFIFIILAVNLHYDVSAYKKRTYAIAAVNEYVARCNFGKHPAIGAWAPTVAWEAKAKTLPVWKDYMNYIAPVKTFHPRLVVSEANEEDSNNAYSSQGINLKEISDSSRTFRIFNYDLVLYWMNY